jgi:hypothetical protein
VARAARERQAHLATGPRGPVADRRVAASLVDTVRAVALDRLSDADGGRRDRAAAAGGTSAANAVAPTAHGVPRSQSIAGSSRASSASFARRNGALPRNAGALREARLADRGEGWVEASMTWRDAMPIRLACCCACVPQRRNTIGSGLAATASMMAPVRRSQPWWLWLPGQPRRTVSTVLSRSTPCRAHGTSEPLVGIGQSRVVGPFNQDVAQRARQRDARRHREGEAVRPIGLVVRVLSEDHRAHRFERCQSQRGEHVVDGRIHGGTTLSPLSRDEGRQAGG